MIKTIFLSALSMLIFVSCTNQVELSGIDKSTFDTSVRPQDDFFQYVNGTWVEETEMPPDKSRYGTFDILYEENQVRLKEIIENAANSENVPGSDAQKVGDFYNSFMDSLKIEELGLDPLQDEFNRIEKVQNYSDLAELYAHHYMLGISRPFSGYISQDAKNSTEYIVYFYQSGLGLPDRDYYFNEDEKFREIRSKYIDYITEILTLTGEEDARSIADKVMSMETSIAEKHWTRVESRNRDKTYNKYSVEQLTELTPNFDWDSFVSHSGISDLIDNVIIRQPSYFMGLSDILSDYTIEDWKNYSKVKLISSFATMLPSAFVDANFDFYGTTLRGTEKNRPRWKRAVSATNASLGEVLGKIYVEKYFKPEAKERMVKLVDNLKLSMADRINKLDWMGEETKIHALAKLDKFNAKIGYPNKWKDYSDLAVKSDELIQNSIRSSLIEYQREIDKLGKPIDRNEWFMTPQTVNAYYSPTMNEIVFPAAILQPPFFNLEADEAVNYGGIGAVIGHEITHGFDDQGRKSDGDGNLVEWWTEEDEKRFMERAQVVVDHYNKFVPIDTMRINGRLSLGENIADIGGLTVSYNAYKMSLDGKESKVLNGFTGEQRVFIGWAQNWRSIYRDDALRNQIVRGPHSPAKYRVLGVMNNMPEFYEAFDVKEGDGHYLPEEKRAKIW